MRDALTLLAGFSASLADLRTFFATGVFTLLADRCTFSADLGTSCPHYTFGWCAIESRTCRAKMMASHAHLCAFGIVLFTIRSALFTRLRTRLTLRNAIVGLLRPLDDRADSEQEKRRSTPSEPIGKHENLSVVEIKNKTRLLTSLGLFPPTTERLLKVSLGKNLTDANATNARSVAGENDACRNWGRFNGDFFGLLDRQIAALALLLRQIIWPSGFAFIVTINIRTGRTTCDRQIRKALTPMGRQCHHEGKENRQEFRDWSHETYFPTNAKGIKLALVAASSALAAAHFP